MKKWEFEAIRDAIEHRDGGQLCEWTELSEALTANGVRLHPGTAMTSVREICRLILAERKTESINASRSEAKALQESLLARDIYASLNDIAEIYSNYCDDFAAASWCSLSNLMDYDHIGPVDYIAARVGNGKPN
jgi:hypothetical protein